MRFLKSLPYILTILTIIAPILLSIDLWEKGPISPKSLKLSTFGTSNVLSTLNLLDEEFDFSLNYGNENVTHLYSVTSLIENDGKSPILPSDFFKGISIEVEKKWKILAVHTITGERKVILEWKYVTEHLFQSAPTLINPGDKMYVTVYLTYANSNIKLTSSSDVVIKPTFDARIANMQSINKSQADRSKDYGLQLRVIIESWGILLFLILFSLFLYLYFWLFTKSKSTTVNQDEIIFPMIGFSLLSIMTAEVILFYVFPSPLLIVFSATQSLLILNISILIIQSSIMGYLFWKVFKNRS